MGPTTPADKPPKGGWRLPASLLLATRDLGLVGVDEQGLAFAVDAVLVDDDLLDVRERRQVEHNVQKRMLDDGTQAAHARAALERAFRDGLEGMFPVLEFDPLHGEEFLVLLHQGVL